jgi:hypothetical protein
MSPLGLLARLIVCVGLMAATWNPSGYSYAHWVGDDAPLSARALATAVLTAAHILFARIAWLSLGLPGLLLVLATIAAGAAALHEIGAIDLGRPSTRGYAAVAALGLATTAGVAWSVVKRRVTGQSNYLNQPP